MHTATPTTCGRIGERNARLAWDTRCGPRRSVAEQLELARVFTGTVACYLMQVLPLIMRELDHWRAKAAEIPDPRLRRTAAESLGKRGNIEGAALFATLAPAAGRGSAVRALVAFQVAYNYLDALSELPSENPIANGAQLHEALARALDPGSPHLDYYAHNPEREDGGFLTAVLDACRGAVGGLPSYATAGPGARAAAARIVDFQALNLTEEQGGHCALERSARAITPAGSGLGWWETAAGAGSSLAVHALIGAAADPALDPAGARGIEAAYFPWIGALHSLLDSVVDRDEDHRAGRRSLLDHYASPTDAAIGLVSLALRARASAEGLRDPHAHRVIVTAMCSYYLSAPECYAAEAQALTGGLRRTLGLPLETAIRMFRSKRLLHTLTRRAFS
jgi:tetraprenyl-beta-curcumene synthase